jgi:hypothetical protein
MVYILKYGRFSVERYIDKHLERKWLKWTDIVYQYPFNPLTLSPITVLIIKQIEKSPLYIT